MNHVVEAYVIESPDEETVWAIDPGDVRDREPEDWDCTICEFVDVNLQFPPDAWIRSRSLDPFRAVPYGPRAMRAWHHGTLGNLLTTQPSAVAARLSAAAAERRLSPNPESLGAWNDSVRFLRRAAADLIQKHPSASDWSYFLEFEVPRRSRRVDTFILAHDVIFLVEWKVGASRFERSAIWQAEQYALDLRDFHEGSHERFIVPMLVATKAESYPFHLTFDPSRFVQEVQLVTPDQLPKSIYDWWRATHNPQKPTLHPVQWEDSPYRPTPTIVRAAEILYERNDVRDLSLSGSSNLDDTVNAVLDLIDRCRRDRRRGIAFITGSPGSGKTLAGLQVVHAPEVLRDSEAAGVFLSGNMPLVSVISAALVESAHRAGRRKNEAEREVKTFIQHAYQFRDENLKFAGRAPHEHVILFDEAQRAWNATQVRRWTRGVTTRSEPELFLDIMSRTPEWAVIIALVGSGQEINSGESGLGEWGRAIADSHPDWRVLASPVVLPGTEIEPPGGPLYEELPTGIEVGIDTRLHLQMNVRSPRAERLNQWMDSFLELDPDRALEAFPDPREYPMVMTRDLATAREWLRDRGCSDPNERTGLLISADARRLRAWGLDGQVLRRERKWADWFLRQPGDVRGSDQLEVAATNFDCQGLEIDWAGIVWGNDLIPAEENNFWMARQFKGTRWQRAGHERARFIVNGYRVILTRARRGQIICVPEPDRRDKTLPPEEFDRIAELLTRAGVPSLD